MKNKSTLNNTKPIDLFGAPRSKNNELRAVSSMERSTPPKPIPNRPSVPKAAK
tara:strand:+ start:750 stop:908 length:159 start_codon:yes stop_codon:yes gene_type:complete